jgi:hypothetical protein
MDINERYVYKRFHQPEISCTVNKDNVIVNVKTDVHPYEDKYKTNCYFYQVLFIQWKKAGDCVAGSQLSEWIFNDTGLPEFDFSFRKIAGLQHWLLAIRLCLGQNKKELNFKVTEAMKIVEAGTVVKSDLELAAKTKKIVQKSSDRLKDNRDNFQRVAPKRLVL